MSPTARTVHIWGFYALAVGLIAALIPNVLLGTLQLPTTDEPWIRVLGVVVIAIGIYYLGGAKDEAVHFFRATVAGRLTVSAGMVILFVAWGYWTAIVFAFADAMGALWTRSALRRTEEASHR